MPIENTAADGGAMELLLQLGRLVYEQKRQCAEGTSTITDTKKDLLNKIISASKSKNPSQAQTYERGVGVRRFPRAEGQSNFEVPKRRTVDHVAQNINKYNYGKPPSRKHSYKAKTFPNRDSGQRRNAVKLSSGPTASTTAGMQFTTLPSRHDRTSPAAIAPNKIGYKETVGNTPSVSSSSGTVTNISAFRRGDVVMHYPFCDDGGSVSDLLGASSGVRAGGSDEAKGIAAAAAPMQRKMIAKVFEEYRVGKTSMKVTDINEALQALGLPPSHALSKGSLGGGYGYLDESTWSAIAMQAIKKVTPSSETSDTEFDNHLKGDISVDNDAFFHSGSRSCSVGSNNSEENMDDNSVVGSSDALAGKAILKEPKTVKSQALQRPSALQLQIRYDRRRFQTEKKLNNRASAQCIAEKRFDKIREDDFFQKVNMSEKAVRESSSHSAMREASQTRYRPRGGGCEIKPNYWVSEETQRASKTSKKRVSATKVDIGSDGYLHSGRAALEIANSYLRGDLYCRLLGGARLADNEKDSVVFEGSGSSDDSGYVSASEGGGWPIAGGGDTNEPHIKHATVNQAMQAERVAKSASSSTVINEDEKKSNAKDADGWRSAKGGWVADFGPLHTHALTLSSAMPRKEFKSNLPQKKDGKMSAYQHDP